MNRRRFLEVGGKAALGVGLGMLSASAKASADQSAEAIADHQVQL